MYVSQGQYGNEPGCSYGGQWWSALDGTHKILPTATTERNKYYRPPFVHLRDQHSGPS